MTHKTAGSHAEWCSELFFQQQAAELYDKRNMAVMSAGHFARSDGGQRARLAGRRDARSAARHEIGGAVGDQRRKIGCTAVERQHCGKAARSTDKR